MGADSLAVLVALGHTYAFGLFAILHQRKCDESLFLQPGRDINSVGQRRYGVNIKEEHFSFIMHYAVDFQFNASHCVAQHIVHAALRLYKASKVKQPPPRLQEKGTLWVCTLKCTDLLISY